MPEKKFVATLRIGPKGQVVIPKEVREMFRLHPGELVLLLADVDRGIALQRLDSFEALTNNAFSHKNPQEEALAAVIAQAERERKIQEKQNGESDDTDTD